MALRDGFTTGSGLGLGLGGAKRLVNEFDIVSHPGEGTRVTPTRRSSILTARRRPRRTSLSSFIAPGATHAPHQVDRYWSDQYKGKFDKGWDVYREEVFQRQKKLGVIPANAILPDRNPDIKAWDKLTPEERKLYARFMEVYAGYLDLHGL